MRRLFFCAAALAALLSSASAEEEGSTPNASERKWVSSCLAKSKDAEASYRECVGVILGACLGLENAPKSVRSSDSNGHPRGCAPVEEKIWDGWLNRWYGEAMKKIPVEAREKLKNAQRAWLAYRTARCEVEDRLHPFPLGSDNRATCSMETTARRALELRTVADDSYDD